MHVLTGVTHNPFLVGILLLPYPKGWAGVFEVEVIGCLLDDLGFKPIRLQRLHNGYELFHRLSLSRWVLETPAVFGVVSPGGSSGQRVST